MHVKHDNNMTICHVVFNKLYILWPHAHAAYLITFHVCIMLNVRLPRVACRRVSMPHSTLPCDKLGIHQQQMMLKLCASIMSVLMSLMLPDLTRYRAIITQ